MRFQFNDHQDEFLVTCMCQELEVSPSGYYAWRRRPPGAREMVNQELFKKIEAVYNDSGGTQGSPRIYHESYTTVVVLTHPLAAGPSSSLRTINHCRGACEHECLRKNSTDH